MTRGDSVTQKILLTALIFCMLGHVAFAASFDKAAYEEFYRYYEFKNIMGAQETVSSATVIIRDATTGADMSSSMVSDVSADKTSVIYKIKGGSPGHSYTVTVRVVTSSGQKFSNDYQELLLCVVRR